jgi:hypothetical protein
VAKGAAHSRSFFMEKGFATPFFFFTRTTDGNEFTDTKSFGGLDVCHVG